MKLSSTLCGVAGEYFVAAELSRRGYIASLTLRNTRGVDILASNANATKSVGIQVKTNQRGAREWILNRKAEEELAENLVFVFVALPETGKPTYHIVPRSVVSGHVRTDHQAWLKKPGRSGQPHVDTPMRKFKDPEGKYLDRWDLLGLD